MLFGYIIMSNKSFGEMQSLQLVLVLHEHTKFTHPERFLCFLTSAESCFIPRDDLPPGPAYFLTAAKTKTQ